MIVVIEQRFITFFADVPLDKLEIYCVPPGKYKVIICRKNYKFYFTKQRVYQSSKIRVQCETCACLEATKNLNWALNLLDVIANRNKSVPILICKVN